MGKITLYHGSKNGINDTIKPISRDLCDFGKGFYMGTEKNQPLTLIANYENATLYTLELDTEDLIIKDIPLDIHWAMFVAFNRGRISKITSNELYNQYENYAKNADVISGYIANDRMFVVLERFFDGEITDKALIKSLTALKLGKQYTTITQKACDKIKIIEKQILSKEQKDKLKLQSSINRQKGISLAEEICIKYRREGNFFDELLNSKSLITN